MRSLEWTFTHITDIFVRGGVRTGIDIRGRSDEDKEETKVI